MSNCNHGNRAEVQKTDIPDCCESKSKPNRFRKAISLAVCFAKRVRFTLTSLMSYHVGFLSASWTSGPYYELALLEQL